MILVVIPAYNEEATIGNIVQKIIQQYDVLVIDDGSIDNTSKIAKIYGAMVIKSKKNCGVDESIDKGFKFALKKKIYKYVITFDADGQHFFNDLKKVSSILKKNKKDLVIGERPNFPRISEVLFSYYTKKVLGFRDLLTGLKGYSLKIYQKYGTFCSFNSIGTELSIFAIKNNYSVAKIKIRVRNRKDQPRIGGVFKANFRIIKSLVLVLFKM